VQPSRGHQRGQRGARDFNNAVAEVRASPFSTERLRHRVHLRCDCVACDSEAHAVLASRTDSGMPDVGEAAILAQLSEVSRIGLDKEAGPAVAALEHNCVRLLHAIERAELHERAARRAGEATQQRRKQHVLAKLGVVIALLAHAVPLSDGDEGRADPECEQAAAAGSVERSAARCGARGPEQCKRDDHAERRNALHGLEAGRVEQVRDSSVAALCDAVHLHIARRFLRRHVAPAAAGTTQV